MENLDNYTLFFDNEKLVPFIFNKYFNDLLYIKQDILQSGRLGLWKACLKYDQTKGKFSPFACKYIKDEMSKFAKNEIRYRNICEEEPGGEFEIFESIGEEDDVDTSIEVKAVIEESKYKKEFARIMEGETVKSIAREKGKPYHTYLRQVNKEKERLKEKYGKGRNRL